MNYTYEHMEDLEGVIFPDFKQYSGNLIVYGAGINGILSAFALKEQGVAFLCFCDNDPLKQGTTYLGYPIYSPEECAQRFPNAAVLFDVYCSGKNIESLKALGFHTILFPAGLFLNLDCDKAAAYITNELGRGDDGYSFREEVDAMQVFEWIEEYMIRGVHYVNGKSEISRAVNIDLTDRCTLRCRNCLALKAYYEKRTELPWEEMAQVLDRLTSIKWFRRFHLMGGEPFLYPYLDKVVKKLSAVPEVEHINILTNGTVIPSESVLKALKNPKVMVRISYYGELSDRYKELENLCHKRGIEIRVHAQRWKDIGRPQERSSEAQTEATFGECSQRAGAFFYILHGKATLCPFAANTHALGLYQPDGEDVFDIRDTASPQELLDKLNALYWREKPLNACYYCNGWLPYATKPVPVAEQCAQGERLHLPGQPKA